MSEAARLPSLERRGTFTGLSGMGLSSETPKRNDERVGAFARDLAEASGEHDVCQLIVDTTALAVNAQRATLATYDDETASLAIRATRGYPVSLVEHLRIPPGSGVIGRTFASRQPLLVIDVRREPETYPPRRRYRTPSFLAVPLLAGGDAVGVLSFTDRADGQPFDQADLAVLQGLGAPAALALVPMGLLQQKRRLEHALALDPLTGLFNRRYFETRFQEEIERARRHSLDIALLAIDVDQFKALNDRLGHSAGDSVLRGVAKILRESVRVFDVCARHGGDEFALLLPGSGASSAERSAERIRQRVERYRPESIPPTHQVTVSIGLALLTPGATSQDLMARADRALYQAKASGRNCVRSGA